MFMAYGTLSFYPLHSDALNLVKILGVSCNLSQARNNMSEPPPWPSAFVPRCAVRFAISCETSQLGGI